MEHKSHHCMRTYNDNDYKKKNKNHWENPEGFITNTNSTFWECFIENKSLTENRQVQIFFFLHPPVSALGSSQLSDHKEKHFTTLDCCLLIEVTCYPLQPNDSLLCKSITNSQDNVLQRQWQWPFYSHDLFVNECVSARVCCPASFVHLVTLHLAPGVSSNQYRSTITYCYPPPILPILSPT